MLSIFAQELLGDICMNSGDCFTPKVSKQTSLGLGKMLSVFLQMFSESHEKGGNAGHFCPKKLRR